MNNKVIITCFFWLTSYKADVVDIREKNNIPKISLFTSSTFLSPSASLSLPLPLYAFSSFMPPSLCSSSLPGIITLKLFLQMIFSKNQNYVSSH